MTFFVGVLVVLSVYEWCHFLIHTNYKFRSRWGRAMYFNHRRHHWLDESAFMGLLFPPLVVFRGWKSRGTAESGSIE